MPLNSVLALETLFDTLRNLGMLGYKRMFVITMDEYFLPVLGSAEQVVYAYIEIWDDFGMMPVYSKRVKVIDE